MPLDVDLPQCDARKVADPANMQEAMDNPAASQRVTPKARLAHAALAALPERFVWGVSTSSYQIEGATREDGRGPSVWDTIVAQKGSIANGETGDVACDHYHRYAEDVALMRDLGVQAYRFSVAWPRVLPQGRGEINEKGLAFYDRLIDALLAAGIEPWLCLYHWDLPQALDDLGGWLNRDSAGWFADYATLIGRRCGDRVKRYATFNEPSVFTFFGYGRRADARSASDAPSLARAIHHVNLAHGAAIDALRTMVPAASLGAIHNWQPCHVTDGDEAACELLDAYWNRAFPDPQLHGVYPNKIVRAIEPYIQPGDLARICRPVDWFGLNHYGPIYAKTNTSSPLGLEMVGGPADAPRSPMGWVIDPSAFRDTLITVHRRYQLPIYVMENGLGGHDKPNEAGEIVDDERIDYLNDYTEALTAAVSAGADVRGYFVWSLLDNFEWNSGYNTRFGLVYIDYATLRRIPKASYRWYAQLIKDARRRG
jgi:beta-glucosidase